MASAFIGAAGGIEQPQHGLVSCYFVHALNVSAQPIVGSRASHVRGTVQIGGAMAVADPITRAAFPAICTAEHLNHLQCAIVDVDFGVTDVDLIAAALDGDA